MPTHVGISAIVERHDVSKGLAKTPAIGVVHIQETHDRPKSTAKIILTGVAHIREAHDTWRPIANATAHVIETKDTISNSTTVSCAGRAIIRESSEWPGHAAPVGAQATIQSGRSFGPANHGLTIVVDTSSGGSVTGVVITFGPGVRDRASAIMALLNDLDRCITIYTLQNSTFN